MQKKTILMLKTALLGMLMGTMSSYAICVTMDFGLTQPDTFNASPIS